MQSYPTELEALRAALPQVQTPVQIISGRRDAVVPPINAEYLHERLPHSELHLIDATHFIWEDAADEYARLVNAWWAGGFTTCMKTSNTNPKRSEDAADKTRGSSVRGGPAAWRHPQSR